jgi:hypothetical protein
MPLFDEVGQRPPRLCGVQNTEFDGSGLAMAQRSLLVQHPTPAQEPCGPPLSARGAVWPCGGCCIALLRLGSAQFADQSRV